MRRLPSYLFFLVLAAIVWRVFFPALMSYDSFVQFREAWTGHYDDWHPPLMAVVLHGFLKLGRGIGAVMLAQCVAGLFGVRALVLAWLAAFFGPAVPPRRAEGIAMLTVLLLVLPVSPLPFYLATFWKDSWAAVLMLWTCAVSFRLLGEPPEADAAGRRRTWARILALLALSAALGMVRHNAVVSLPFAGLVLAIAVRRRSRGLAVLMVAAPLLVCAVAERAIGAVFHVHEMHLERHMMAFDLLGVCTLDAQACDAFPFFERHILLRDYARRYVPGDMGESFWSGPPVLDLDVTRHGDLLRAEYLRAVRRFPGLFARVKLEAFAPLVDPHETHHFIYLGMDANELGLRLNPRFAPLRAGLTNLTLEAGAKNPFLRLISGVHLVWLIAAAVWTAALLVSRRRRSLALVMLLPLSFYLSYLLASPAADYRFMYPATLTMQVVTVAWVVAMVARRTLTPGLSPVPSHPPSPGEGNPRPKKNPEGVSPSSPGSGEEGRGDEGSS
jgi:hypothetical protein